MGHFDATIKAVQEEPRQISRNFLNSLKEDESDELIKFLKTMSEKSKEKN